MSRPNLLYLHICDDVRQEINGKISMMGIYNSSIVVPEIPYSISKLCFYSRFSGITNKHVFNFSIVNPVGEEAKIIENSLCEPEGDADQGIFNVVASPFQLNQEGSYEIIINIVELDQEEATNYKYTQKFSVVDLIRIKKDYTDNSQEY